MRGQEKLPFANALLTPLDLLRKVWADLERSNNKGPLKAHIIKDRARVYSQLSLPLPVPYKYRSDEES